MQQVTYARVLKIIAENPSRTLHALLPLIYPTLPSAAARSRLVSALRYLEKTDRVQLHLDAITGCHVYDISPAAVRGPQP